MLFKRHVHEGGDASGCSRASRVREALPIGTPGIVDVDVRINDAGQHDCGAGVQLGDAGGPVADGSYRDNAAVADEDRRRADAIRQDHALTVNDQGHAPSCGEPISE